MKPSAIQWNLAVGITALLLCTACSSTTSAPFHMYSSPLLEGETERSRVETGDDESEAAGVEPRQIYAYQRWHPDELAAPKPRQIQRASDSRTPGSFDTVDAPSRPVLASYEEESDDSRTVNDGSAGQPRDGATETAPVEEPDEQEITESATTVEDDETPQTGDEPAGDAAAFVHEILSVNDIDIDGDTRVSIAAGGNEDTIRFSA